MSETNNGVMTCQLCGGDGEYVETHLVGDGLRTETELEEREMECRCGNGLLADPEVTVGLYLGKFAPFHGGHQYCLDQALDDCDHVIVLIYHTGVLDIPLQVRADWIRDLYSDEAVSRNGDGSPVDGATLDVIEAWAGPESHGYTEEIEREHEEYVLDLLSMRGYTRNAVDRFYSSEPYGQHMSQALGATDVRVDPDREVQPISATMIREDGAYKHRNMIPDTVYRDLVTRVAIVGGVSSGKTTLARALADHYDTEWMPEHGREFWQEHADEDGMLTKEELHQLAWEHIHEEEDVVLDADTFLFVDTTPLTTMVWSKYYHGSVANGLRKLAEQSAHVYDLHVLCDPHIPFEEDEGRDGRINRKRLHRLHRALMDEYNIDYITVGGSVESRVQQVEKAITKNSVGLHDRVAKPEATNRWSR